MKDTIVRGNEVATENSFGILLNSGGPNSPAAKSSTSEIYENNLYNCQSGIILFNSDDCKIFRNYVHDSMGGGILVQWRSHRASVHYNIINNLRRSVFGDVYNGIDVNAGSTNGAIYNNTVRKVDSASCTIEDYFEPCNGWVIRNNIFDARENSTNGAPIQVFPGVTNITLSNNNYVANQQVTGKMGRWRGVWKNLVEWNEASGDTGSISSDPKFVDPVTEDFGLQKTSPCIQAGTNVGLSQDFRGAPLPTNKHVDMGALAYFSVSPPINVRVNTE